MPAHWCVCVCVCVCVRVCLILYTLMMHGTPTNELLAILACQIRWTDTASRVSVTGGVVEAVVVSTGREVGWGADRHY